MNNYTPDEPIVAIATALAPSALGVIRLSGKNSIELLSKVFSREKILQEAQGNTLVYGWIINKNESSALQKIDEVMVGVYRAPKSFTGEEMAEIFCHGGTTSVLAIYTLLQASGFRVAEPGEFTFRAFIHSKIDLTQAEAVNEIISAKTDEGRSRAVGRLAGALYAEIENIKKLVIETLADIEAEVEYPEDENAIANAFNSNKLEEAYEKLMTIANSWASEKMYQDGVRVVLAGKTNAGKSSLFNALLKEDRAIVSDIHGTTRDWIESWLSLNGIPARLFDTAGIRETDDVIEKAGLERSYELVRDADVVLYLVDVTRGLQDEEKETIKKYKTPVVLVWNKCDVLEKNGQEIDINELCNFQVRISSKNGLGIDNLITKTAEIIKGKKSTERIQAGLGTQRQKKAVDDALEALEHALEATKKEMPLDAIGQDLDEALQYLGEITGVVSADDILESIFSRFCVGK